MAESGKKISGYDTYANSLPANTWLVVEINHATSNNKTYKIPVHNLFANVSANVTFSNAVLSVNNFIVRRGDTPANSTITATEGTMWCDDNYLYVAVANNSLKRVALTSF